MAVPRWVVLDDQDSAITYTGTWFPDFGGKEFVDNYGSPYLHTLHGTSSDGSIALDFNGTAIEVRGTNIVANSSTNPDPNLECYIDGASIGRDPPYFAPENNWKLCSKDGLSDGLHKLRIDVRVQSTNQTFWLDQVRYVPLSSMALDNKTIMLDHLDPAIHFDSNWIDLGGVANVTTHTNSSAQLDFIGTSVSWVAFTPTEFPHTGTSGLFAIDGDEPTRFLLPGLPPGDETATQYNQIYFTTPEVKAGQHTLTVTFLGTNLTTPLSLGYLYITNGTFPTTGPGNNNTNTTTTTTTPQSHTDSGGGNSDKGSSGKPVGAILGGVLGGLSLLIILAALFLFRRRWTLPNLDKSTKVHKSILAPFNYYYYDHKRPPSNSNNTVVESSHDKLDKSGAKKEPV